MRIAIYGAGAVGGHIAVRLGRAGHDVSVVARGEHLDAIRRNGITLTATGEKLTTHPRASDRPSELGEQDLVVSTLKSNALGALAEGVPHLLGPDTPVIFAQNGIPWWYAAGLRAGAATPPDLTALDPGGRLAEAVAPERVVGCVITSQNDRPQPGFVHHHGASNDLTIGEVDDSQSPRIAALRALLVDAGFGSPAIPDIRIELWTKLLRNLSNSLLGLIMLANSRTVGENPHLTTTRRRIVEEGLAIAAAHGLSLDEERVTAGSGSAHKASFLQDYEAGRPMEVECLVRAPLAFARAADVPTPTLDTVCGIAVALAAQKGLYDG
jgi:2-dehydropantoate 2-reductase